MVVEAFLQHERRRGVRALAKIPGLLAPLFRYLEEGGLGLENLDYRGAQEYQSALSALTHEGGGPRYATASVAELVSAARRFYRYLRTVGLVVTNPFEGVRGIKQERKLPRGMPDEATMERILEGFRRFWLSGGVRAQRTVYRLHVIAELMYATGLRVSEVAALKAQDLDLERRLVLVRGKGKERFAYLNEYAASVLRVYLARMREVVAGGNSSGTVFGVYGKDGLIDTLNKYLREAGRKAGVEHFTSHSFRHALGFHLLRRGADMRYIQLILGHERLKTTGIYTRVAKDDLKGQLDRYHPRRRLS